MPMVMHARKLPRLNDGYFDRHDYHEDKNERFQGRVNSYDKVPHVRRARDEYGVVNDNMRYNHKLPYNDRVRTDRERHKCSKEKDRYPREEYRNSVDRYQVCSRTASNNHRNSNSSSDTPGEFSLAENKEYNRISDDHKSVTVSTATSEKSQSNQTKEQSQKVALRVCGDWSEHVSSSGKKYFYNCKTEISQWVKPKEWKNSDEQVKQANVRVVSSSANSSKANRDSVERNGSINRSVSVDSLESKTNHNKANSSNSLDSYSTTNTSSSDLGGSDKTDKLYPDSYTCSQGGVNVSASDKSKSSREINGTHAHHLHDVHSSFTSPALSSSSRGTASPSAVASKTAKSSEKKLPNGNTDGSGDDMDISPDGSPKTLQKSGYSVSSGSKRESGKLERVEHRREGGSQQPANTEQNMIWGKALQTLQTLQEVLERSRSNSNHTTGTSSAALYTEASPRSAHSQSPKVIPPPAQMSHVERIPEETSSGKSSLVSEASLATLSTLPAAVESPGTIGSDLTQSFINYYDPALVSHISGWPAEQLELRAHMAYKDGMIICGHHCGQVSTELKRDRSYVRIAEVQSTLIEHRIMFLKQQISELETHDKSFTSSQT